MYTHTALEWRCDGTVNFDCSTFKILSFVVKSKQYRTWVDVHCCKIYVWQLDVSNKVHTCKNHCLSKCELLSFERVANAVAASTVFCYTELSITFVTPIDPVVMGHRGVSICSVALLTTTD